jgi:hypothetical protein
MNRINFLSKNGMFVGKGYSCNGMIKMNVMEENSVYFVSSLNLWHGRLGHSYFYGSLHSNE